MDRGMGPAFRIWNHKEEEWINTKRFQRHHLHVVKKIGNGGRVQTTPDHDSVENISISGQNLVQGPVE